LFWGRREVGGGRSAFRACGAELFTRHCEEGEARRSNPLCASALQVDGLLRRFAPRNDEL
jgi:hypothetical protein